ncbi:hypothetical protein ACIODS_04300 [Micromonospora chalcea]|uniref:hypothetical protein n=1 Tax=Micromonospora chalcea TaxID=1874 RepID=UPI0038017728
MTERPIEDMAYTPVGSGQISVALPGRHVAPEVYAAAERFARACAAVRKAQAEIESAGHAVHETENRVMSEAYRAVAEDTEIDEGTKLGQSEEWVLAKSAEETARTRFNGDPLWCRVHGAMMRATAPRGSAD